MPEHRHRGRRVGRGDDGAQGHRRGQREAGLQPARHDRHGRDGERHGPERETGDGAPVLPQVARRAVVGGVEQHRRHEQREGQLGIEVHCRRMREQREPRPGEREQGGVGHVHPAGPGGQDRAGEE